MWEKCKQSWCSRNYKQNHIINQGGRKVYGNSHHSVPENFLQQIIEQLDYKQLKDNKVVGGSQ